MNRLPRASVRRPFAVSFAALVALAVAGPPARAAAPVGLIAAAASGQGSYGAVKGKLVWGGAEAPAKKVLEAKGKASKDPSVCAASGDIVSNDLVVDAKTKGVRYGIVYLVRPKGTNADAVKALVDKKPKVEVDQKNCEFAPPVVAIHQDQTVVFKSSDPVNHNIHLSPFTNPAVNVLMAPGGEMDKKLMTERRPIPLTCDIHPWMKGYLMVFDHPFFAVTGADGTFEIKGIPAGDQKIVVWQSSAGYVTAGKAAGLSVAVKAGETTDMGEVKLDPATVK